MKTLGVIDIGTNSIRLAVARVDRASDIRTLLVQKEVVRLGEGAFAHHRITDAAMDRGVLVIKKFADIARRSGASEIVAVATAAVREAANRTEFIERARSEAAVEVRVVSGLEEARLIYMGISSGVELNSDRALFIDIGGGTTEIVLGDAREHYFLDSLKLGAIRLADMFLSGRTGRIPKKTYRVMLDYARGAASHAVKKASDLGFDTAFGSSGTIINLAEITARRVAGEPVSVRNYALSHERLRETISILCDLDLEKRRQLPGINPERADIIVSGAAILDAVMSGVGASSIIVSDRALREGILVDHLFQEDRARQEFLGASARERSVRQLCRSCLYEEEHSEKVMELTCSLFDQARDLGMHDFGPGDRDLAGYAALVHDVGTFIAHGDHHRHTYYLTRNWGLLGFDDEEVEVIATAAMCHRKISPKKAVHQRLRPQARRLVEVISSILRIAEALDRSQLGLVTKVVLRPLRGTSHLSLEVHASEDCPLEMWSVETRKTLFEQTFNSNLSIELVVD